MSTKIEANLRDQNPITEAVETIWMENVFGDALIATRTDMDGQEELLF